MPVSGGRVGKASALASASASAADNSNAKPSNRGRTDLAYTQKMERIDDCKVIRFPRQINLNEDERPEFTPHQVHMMQALLENNNVELSQFSTTPATDDERRSMNLSIARAYNATISEQQRKIINQYKRTPRFTFSYIERYCYPGCKLRGYAYDRSLGFLIGCTSHDLVKYPWDEESGFGFHQCLVQARYALNCSHIGLTPEYQIESVPRVASSVRKSMDEIDERLDDYISMDARTASELYEEKFLALDAQYKILHCLLTENNLITREIKAKREHWEPLETCFMKVFERFDKDDLHRLATDDDGIWCDMFDFVCEFADKEGILLKLNEARKTIAESFLTRQEDLAKWVKRLKGT